MQTKADKLAMKKLNQMMMSVMEGLKKKSKYLHLRCISLLLVKLMRIITTLVQHVLGTKKPPRHNMKTLDGFPFWWMSMTHVRIPTKFHKSQKWPLWDTFSSFQNRISTEHCNFFNWSVNIPYTLHGTMENVLDRFQQIKALSLLPSDLLS